MRAQTSLLRELKFHQSIIRIFRTMQLLLECMVKLPKEIFHRYIFVRIYAYKYIFTYMLV